MRKPEAESKNEREMEDAEADGEENNAAAAG